MSYNLTVKNLGKDSVYKSFAREYRFLVKEKSGWKIVSQVSLSPEMLVLTPTTIEDNINLIAFKLLDDKKNEEAFEMFKVNIKLYPASWHAYDSIGEAYATTGNKDEAILNYKKSLELNPDSLIGKVALEKLQAQ